MLRYKGETFNMVDCEGVSHKVVQVTSIKAKKAYEDGKPVWMHPCNMRVNNMWQIINIGKYPFFRLNIIFGDRFTCYINVLYFYCI